MKCHIQAYRNGDHEASVVEGGGLRSDRLQILSTVQKNTFACEQIQ